MLGQILNYVLIKGILLYDEIHYYIDEIKLLHKLLY